MAPHDGWSEDSQAADFFDEKAFQAIADTLPVGVSLAQDRKIKWCNAAFMKMLGFDGHNDYLDKSVEFLYASRDEFKRGACVLYKDLEPGKVTEMLTKHRRKDGSLFDAHVQMSLLNTSDSGKTTVVVCTTDVSQQIQAQEALQKSEERYRALVEESFDGVLIHDGTKILFANSRECEMLGYRKEELEGMGLFLTVHPDDREFVRRRAEARMRGETVSPRYEIRLVRKDGSSLDVETTARPITLQNKLCLQEWVRDVSERKKAREAISYSEERYRTLVEESFDGVMILKGETLAFSNSRLSKMFGYSKEELSHMKPWMLAHPDYQDLVRTRTAKRLQGKSPPARYEIRFRRKDGSTFDAEMNARVIKVQGEPGVQVWIKDISERKRAEEALRESEKKYRAVFDNAAMGINLNRYGHVLEANSAWAKMLGYSQSELRQLTFFGITHPDDVDVTQQYHDALVRGEADSYRLEKRYIRKDGQVLWADVCVSPIRDEAGQYQATISTIIDISDKKRAEEAREIEREKFQTLVDNAPFGMVMIGTDDTFKYVNPKFSEIFGYSLQDVPDGRNWFKKAYPDEGYRHEVIATWIRDKKEYRTGEHEPWTFTVTCADGTKKTVNFRPVQLRTGDYLMSCEDITQALRDEQERGNLRHQLLHAQKMEAIGTLVGGIAHDFNNMLTIILGHAELLLLENKLDDRSSADLQKIVETAISGAALVQSLLTFSSQADARLQVLNLNREIEKVRGLLSRTISRMISFELKLDEDLADINADMMQIQQVLMNLALNAVDAMPDGGKLTFETKNVTLDEDYCRTHPGISPGNYVFMAVSDNGRGMDDQTIARIFEPFFTTKQRATVKGTGLGLAIVHGIVQGHAGYVSCISEPGRGARFELYFPALTTASEKEVESEVRLPTAENGTQTVLLVDDEELMRDLGERILKSAGYRVITAVNGKEAVDIYRKELGKISLVILDLIMPEMGGKECLKELLKIDPKVKILIATGYSSGHDEDRLIISALASGFITKPFTISEMLRVVREILYSD
ncbi:MAG TPA: PAS domain S-box protein [Desulfomonilaceae bacterium]|nr:PAS domain S-box protein [Desulfomonilaceae bacterium]